MRLGRTLPPAASPIPLVDIFRALSSCLKPEDVNSRFSREIKHHFESKYCFLLSSGKTALTIILLALKQIYPERDQVVVPAFTCYSVPAAVKRAGLQVKLCDVGRFSLDFDISKLETILSGDRQTGRILCVLATHLFGCPASLKEIHSVTGLKIPIVEDAAQAMGESLDNMKLGTFGDIGFYSLGRGKALSTIEGGVIVTNRDDLAGHIAELAENLSGYTTSNILKLVFKAAMSTLLQYPSLFWLPKALPFLKLGETLYEPAFPMRHLSSFQVNLARDWRQRLARHRRARVNNLNYWKKMLPGGYALLCGMNGTGLVRLPVLAHTTEQRNYILKRSEQEGLGIMPGYPATINNIPELREEFYPEKYPQAMEICDLLFTIPVHEYVTKKENERILHLLGDAITEGSV